MSAIISKLLEQYILKESENFSFSSAKIATAIAHDAGSYCVANEYYSSLHAAGAFDLWPHCVPDA